MEITQLEATRRLARVGVHRPSAVRLLRAGFAGPGRPTGGTVRAARILYDEESVDRLAARPVFLTFPLVPLQAPAAPAALVVRSHARRADITSACGWSGVDLLAPREEQREAVRRTRAMSLGAWAQAAVERLRDGRLRIVVTMDSFVALGADVLALDVRDGRTILELGAPGPWFTPLEGARLWSGLGAERRWLTLDPRLTTTA